MAHNSLFVMACLFVFSCVGCGTGASKVEGVVRFDNQPVPNASIQFIPLAGGRDATGMTNDKGEFAMSTNEPGDGVMKGTYKVVITPLGKPDNRQYASQAEAMAALPATPTPAQPPIPNFPARFSSPSETPLTQEVPVKGKVIFDLKSN